MNLQMKLVTYGADKCNISYSEIEEISQMVAEKYNFSSPYFLDVENVQNWLCVW